MLSQLDIIAFEPDRVMPYRHSEYPAITDPNEKMVEDAREKVQQLKKLIAEYEAA